jgi:ATP-dependent RNA helicase DDX52/ROK1
MNVFKLLSRSSNAPQNAPAQRLPSSGAVANPQLFGHDEQERPTESSKSRKRKRGQASADAEESLPADLDFFNSEPSKGNKRKRKGKPAPSDEAETQAVLEVEEDGGVGLDETQDFPEDDQDDDSHDEDECKRILRSHKLKIVVLEDFAAGEEKATKKETKDKKKSKKRKLKEEEEAKKAKKKDKKQLFPRPLTSFGELRTRYGISRRLAQNIDAQGYKMPTEVQLAALPLLLGNKRQDAVNENVKVEPNIDASGQYLSGDIDLLTVAPTGSGKTIAFLVPVIEKLIAEAKSAPQSSSGPRAIVVAPTRELASQIVNEARKLATGTGIKTALMKKGMEVVERPDVEDQANGKDVLDVSEDEENESDGHDSDSEDEKKAVQTAKRKRGRAAVVKAAILVATPLALLNALKLPGDKVADLPSVRYLVLDEADVLLDPLFREQTLAVWGACTNPSLRVGLWSATMGSNIEALVIDTLNSRWKSLASSPPTSSRPPLIRIVVGLKDSALPNIHHKLIYAATEQGKLLGLRQILHPTATPASDTSASLRPPFLVFTQTIPRATALHSELLYDIPPEAGGSSRIAVLHANLSSSARSAIMTRFRRGEVWVLITTDLLARGVDFRGLNGVVNYDVPNSAAAYVHRVGRTGRAGREGGVAVTFYTKEDIPYIKGIANVIRAAEKLRGKTLGGEGQGETIKQWLLDALPTPTKRDKQRLKKRGVEARREIKDEKGRNRARISTKSGYERRMEDKIRGAKMASKAREGGVQKIAIDSTAASESEFEGFD